MSTKKGLIMSNYKYNIECEEFGDKSNHNGWVGISFETYGNNIDELIKNTIFYEIDQDGGDVANYDIDEITDSEFKKMKMIIEDKMIKIDMKRRDYEIDAQVHAIKQLKRDFNKSWDFLSWHDIVQFKPSFDVIRNQLKQSTPKVQKDYFKRMTKRLNREKLLGKLMQKTFMRDMIQ